MGMPKFLEFWECQNSWNPRNSGNVKAGIKVRINCRINSGIDSRIGPSLGLDQLPSAEERWECQNPWNSGNAKIPGILEMLEMGLRPGSALGSTPGSVPGSTLGLDRLPSAEERWECQNPWNSGNAKIPGILGILEMLKSGSAPGSALESVPGLVPIWNQFWGHPRISLHLLRNTGNAKVPGILEILGILGMLEPG
ncbi:hypothetical protein TURU_001849 [Turdus rufiventris]|nr:hypothetical protein TURU_001851 [Turdus rufiventris]KAF4805189.1 hypothetical protein TURU_001849 [Turdus rufiventris]